MAMAAVRFAARRLAGQQPPVIFRSAVATRQGPLLTGLNHGGYARRFASSEAAPKINTEHPSAAGAACDERKHFFSRLMFLDQKKEELYDLLAEIQRNKHFSDSSFIRRKQNRRLLQRLTVHVDPRPNNSEWRWYLGEHIVNICLGGTATFLAFLYMTEKWSSFFYGNKQVQGADNNTKASVSCAEPDTKE